MIDQDDEPYGVLLGQWVRDRRKVLGLTQENLSERMGLDWDPNRLGQMESGRKKGLPDLLTLEALGAALGAPLVEVLRACGLDIPDNRATLTPEATRLHALIDAVPWPKHPDWQEVLEPMLQTYVRLSRSPL